MYRVLYKHLAITGKCKLTEKWEKGPYIVVEKLVTDNPVYKDRKEFDGDDIRTSLRNWLS